MIVDELQSLQNRAAVACNLRQSEPRIHRIKLRVAEPPMKLFFSAEPKSRAPTNVI